MRYEDMPKGRNKDRCVRCGKRYNFADKALSKAKVPYDLLCLAEVTTSGYMTHGNVKLCDECMVELLMWLDRKTELQTERSACDTCQWYNSGIPCGVEPSVCKREVKDEPQLTPNYCGTCKHREVPCGDLPCDVCHGYSNYEPKDEPQTDEPTWEQVKEYCNKRCLDIVDSALRKKWYKDEPQMGDAKPIPLSNRVTHIKDEPKTQTKTQNSNLTFEKDECAKEYEELGLKELKELIEADRKTESNSEKPNNCEDEPTISKMEQVEDETRLTAKCLNCANGSSYKCSKCDGEMYYKYDKDEPQIFICPIQNDYEALIEDEPQTDCPWMKGE